MSVMGVVLLYSFYYAIYYAVLVIGLDTIRFYVILTAIITTILIVILKIKQYYKV